MDSMEGLKGAKQPVEGLFRPFQFRTVGPIDRYDRCKCEAHSYRGRPARQFAQMFCVCRLAGGTPAVHLRTCTRYDRLLRLVLVLVLVLSLLSGCKSTKPNVPLPGIGLKKTGPTGPDPRRLQFAQIVEDDEQNVFLESAILEGLPFKYLLKCAADTTHDGLRKQTNDQITFEHLMNEPGMYRGQVVTLARGIIVDVTQASLPPDYGLPPGYTVLPAIFVDIARDVYALRILCPPGSKLYPILKAGIDNDAYPVLRITGYFMKLYARNTADPQEPPWRRPLLICPEPEFSQVVEPRKISVEEQSIIDKFLPSQRIVAWGAEERQVFEVSATNDANGFRVSAEGLEAGENLRNFITARIGALRSRLPADQADHPAAVVLLASDAPSSAASAIVSELRAAGAQRIAVKREPFTPRPLRERADVSGSERGVRGGNTGE